MVRTIFKWGMMVLGCLIIVYGIWVGVAMSRTATISVDYVAAINEKAAAIPESQQAWPLYREAGIALRAAQEPEGNLFSEDDVEFGIFEVGLGGRYDATNAWDSSLAVLTRIQLDHTAVLGNTLTEIASEKLP